MILTHVTDLHTAESRFQYGREHSSKVVVLLQYKQVARCSSQHQVPSATADLKCRLMKEPQMEEPSGMPGPKVADVTP